MIINFYEISGIKRVNLLRIITIIIYKIKSRNN